MASTMTNADSQQASTNNQVGVQTSDSSSAVVAGAGANIISGTDIRAGGNVTVLDAGAIHDSFGAIEGVAGGAAAVALQAINGSRETTLEALSLLQQNQNSSNALVAGATQATQQIASNAQQLAYGQPDQALTTTTNNNSKLQKISIGLGVAGLLVALIFLLKKK